MNTVNILSVAKEQRHLNILFGKASPQYKVVSFLLNHFYKNEILETNMKKLATKLHLSVDVTSNIVNDLIKNHKLIQSGNLYFLSTDFVLNK